MADDMEHLPPVNADREARRANRAARRQQMHRPQPPVDIEPEPDPSTCTWCGFVAYFEDEKEALECTHCPACGELFGTSPKFGDEDYQRSHDAVTLAVQRRAAFALDRIAEVIAEAWDTMAPPESSR